MLDFEVKPLPYDHRVDICALKRSDRRSNAAVTSVEDSEGIVLVHILQNSEEKGPKSLYRIDVNFLVG